MSDPRTRVVENGYDAIADDFAEWRDADRRRPARLVARAAHVAAPEGARVLELGCGAGHDARVLPSDSKSPASTSRPSRSPSARASVPNATFVQADFTAPDFEPGSFDAVAAVYCSTTSRATCWCHCSTASTHGSFPAGCCLRRSGRATSRRGSASGSGRRCSSRASRARRRAASWTRPASNDSSTSSRRWKPEPDGPSRSTGCSRGDELPVRPRALPRAPRGGERGWLSLRAVRGGAAGGRPLPPPRRRPLARGRGRDGRAGGRARRPGDLPPDDRVRLLQPRVRGGRGGDPPAA